MKRMLERMVASARMIMDGWRQRPPGCRTKREDCLRTKHDSIFSDSDWKVLTGPSALVDNSLRKDGVGKCRIHNLPDNCSCPGLYELGVAVVSANNDDSVRHISDKTIAVYLGHSVNVKKRLQCHGRVGSQLDHVSASNIRNICECYCSWNEPQFYSEMFSKSYPVVHQWALNLHNGLGKILRMHIGQSENDRTRLQENEHAGSHLDHECTSSITNGNKRSCLQNRARDLNYVFLMYRWAPMCCKNQAEKMEAQLLEHFDYAWNKRRNGAYRHEDILLKLENKPSSLISAIFDKLLSWKYTFSQKKLGINSCEDSSDDKVGLINSSQGCGMPICNRHIYTEKPRDGKKTYTKHQERKTIGTKSSKIQVRVLEKSNIEKMGSETNEAHIIVQLEFLISSVDRLLNSASNTVCKAKSSLRCDRNLYNEEEPDICGIVLSDGSVCSKRPVPGRKRCILHKRQKIKAIKYMCNEEEHDICGIILSDGSLCSNRPLPERKRCVLHKRRRIKPVYLQ